MTEREREKQFAVKLALLRVLIVEVSSEAISCTAGLLHTELSVLLTKNLSLILTLQRLTLASNII